MAASTVHSADGTAIAYTRSGRGPALIVVGGALSDRSAAGSLSPLLEPNFTVFAYDRCGRGDSGDHQDYSVEREVEDLAAVVGLASEPAFVYGHSGGAILTLEAALQGVPIARMALYEPPYIVDDQRPRPPADLPAQLEAMLSAGDADAAVRTFLKAGPGMPDPVIEQIRSSPVWPAYLKIATTVVYDARVAGECILDRDRFGRIATPALVLHGGASPGWMQAGTSALADALPHGELSALAGQDHSPAPQLIVAELARFLR